jgi:hypothetical protein
MERREVNILPLKIMKLAIAATSVINVNPLVTRLFYEVPAASTGPTTLSIDPASFFSDTGDPATVLPVSVLKTVHMRCLLMGCCKWRI